MAKVLVECFGDYYLVQELDNGFGLYYFDLGELTDMVNSQRGIRPDYAYDQDRIKLNHEVIARFNDAAELVDV